MAEAGEEMQALPAPREEEEEEEQEEEEDVRRLEQLRLEEEAARKREDFEEQQLSKRQEKEEQEQQSRQEGATEGSCSRFDDLERSLEEEEAQQQQRRAEASSTAAASTPFAAGDEAELQVYPEKWVPCCILGQGSKPDTYSVHVLATELFDKAAGRSDTDVPDVPREHLRRVPGVAPPPATKDDSAVTPAASEAAAAEDGAVGTSAQAEGQDGLPATVEVEAAAAAAGAEAAGAEAADAPAAEEPAVAAPPEEPKEPELEVGERILVSGLTDHPQLNNLTGSLVEKKWKGNWVVDLDDEEGKKRRLRRRWLIHSNHLQRTDKPAMQKWSSEMKRPKMQWFIVGTWNDFVPRRMSWDHERLCWTFDFRVGGTGFECFQFWLERDKKRSVHPDTANAGTYVPWELRGPDADGEGKHWSFGDGTENVRYEVRLYLWQDEGPQAVEWSCLDKAKPKEGEVSSPTAAKDLHHEGGGGKAGDAAATELKGVGGSSRVLQEARRFLEGSAGGGDDHDQQEAASADAVSATGSGPAATSVPPAVGAKPPAAAAEPPPPLQVGDRVCINSKGPFSGRHGAIAKLDEEGDFSVKLDTGETRLFFKRDVAKLPPEASKVKPGSVAAMGNFGGRGLGKGSAGLGKGHFGLGRGPGIGGFT